MTEELLSHYQHIIRDYTLITGSKGVFDLKVNGQMLFSKHQEGRHAEPGEILARFQALVGPDVPVYGT